MLRRQILLAAIAILPVLAIAGVPREQAKPFCVDAADILSQNSLVNGLVYAVPLFLLWHSADADQRSLAQRMIRRLDGHHSLDLLSHPLGR
jgi:branched-subunit amino acid permease